MCSADRKMRRFLQEEDPVPKSQHVNDHDKHDQGQKFFKFVNAETEKTKKDNLPAATSYVTVSTTSAAAGEFLQLLEAASPQELSQILAAQKQLGSAESKPLSPLISPLLNSSLIKQALQANTKQSAISLTSRDQQLSPNCQSPINSEQSSPISSVQLAAISQQQQQLSPVNNLQSPIGQQFNQQDYYWPALSELSDFSDTLMEGLIPEEGGREGDSLDMLDDNLMLGAKRIKYSDDYTSNHSNDSMMSSSSPCTNGLPDLKQRFLVRQKSNNSSSSFSSASSNCLSDHTALNSPEVTSGKSKEDLTSLQKFCLVCGDVASGLHYGASSCEACKAFFKRTVQGNVEYVCQAGGQCVMTKRGRKACQACRYNKCVRIGMLREGIRADRQRGGQHKHRAGVLVNNSPPTPNPVHLIKPELGSPTTNKNGDRLLTCLLSIEPQKLYARPDASLDSGAAKLMTALLDLADKELVAMICWAKQIPGFSEIAIENQVSLFHYAWLDLMCLSVAYRSSPYNGLLRFADDCNLPDPGENEGLGKPARHAGLPHHLDTALRSLARRLTELSVSAEEFVILKSLVLMHADMELAEDVPSVRRLRDALYDSLLSYELGRGDPDYHRRIGRLLLILPLVVRSRLRLSDYWRTVKQSGRKIPQRLLSEMIDFSCALSSRGCSGGMGCCMGGEGLKGGVFSQADSMGKGWGGKLETGRSKVKAMFDPNLVLCTDN